MHIHYLADALVFSFRLRPRDLDLDLRLAIGLWAIFLRLVGALEATILDTVFP